MFEDMSIPYQVWLLVGLAFLAADLAMPGLILSFLGLGCLLAGLAAFLVPGLKPVILGGVALAGFLFGILVVRPPLVRARRRRKERAQARPERPEMDEDPFAPVQPRRGPTRLEPLADEAPAAPRAKAAPRRTVRDRSNDLFSSLTAPGKPVTQPPSSPLGQSKPRPSPLSLLDEDDERSGFDLLEPVLDDGLKLSIDEEGDDTLLLTDSLPDSGPAPKPLEAPEPEDDLRLDFSLDAGSGSKPQSPVGRTVTVVATVGPFAAGKVRLGEHTYRAYSDDILQPGAKARVLEQMKEDPEILVVEPSQGM